MNTLMKWKRHLSLTIIALITTLLVVTPISRIEAATVMDGFNTGLDTGAHTVDGTNTSDGGWVYTAAATYTLSRIEAKFPAANGVAITVEFNDGLPSGGGTLLASGSFTPTAAGGGTTWEGVNLNTTVNVVSGTTYFVGFKDFYTSPTTDAAGAAPNLYYSTTPSNYANAGGPVFDDLRKPIVRFLSGDAPVITSAAPAGGTDGTAYSHTYTASGDTPITYSVPPVHCRPA